MKKNGYFVKGLIALSLVGTLAMADNEIANDGAQDMNMHVKSSVQISDNASEVQEKSAAKIGVSDAVQVVKNKFSGKIVGAKLENENGNLVYTVEVFHNNTTNNVTIDAGNSQILASTIDKKDDIRENESGSDSTHEQEDN